MANAENKVVVTNFVEEVINQGHLERADDLVAVDFVELDPLPGQQQGREGLKQVISAFRAAFPDIHWVIEEMIGEGEKVFSRFTCMARIAGNSSAFLPRAGR
jgi:predicted SnoaL-like aldol condensation-catalyzing enzyme